MFKPQKHKSRINSRDKLDFQFSDFHCIEVPEGWDKLFISLVQVGTGKTIVKSGKTTVVNGTCSWTDTFCESLSVSRGNNADSKEGGRSFFKIVVAMGSSRSGILGEVMLDLGKYAKTRTITPLSLELRKCDYGTSLQFNVQCLTERGDTGFDPRISEPTSTFREMNDGNNRSLNPPLHPMGSDSSSPSKVEGRISERDHKKLTANVNSIKKEVIEQSRAHKRLSMELEQDLKFIASDLDEARTEMEEELRFLRKSNTSLVEQLNKTQESNDELLSILQELEGIVEAQKSEIENLSSMKMKVGTNDAVGDSDSFPSEEIDNIKQQLEQLYETQEELEAAIQMLEQTVDEKDSEIERLQDLSTLSVSDYESKWAFTVAAKEEEIMMLKSELADAVKNSRNEELKIAQGNLASVKIFSANKRGW